MHTTEPSEERERTAKGTGKVYLVGAGPGALISSQYGPSKSCPGLRLSSTMR